MSKLTELAQWGQSLWLDDISRGLIDSGRLRQWISQGLRGLTSNPSIFHAAISRTTAYDQRIAELKEAGRSAFEIYDELTTSDVRDAADQFAEVYRQSEGLDGYVSLEINPQLAHDAGASIAEGRRLFAKVGRPNLMIKVPATPEGFPVIEALLADGINVNVTLIFSLDQYLDTVHSYVLGLRARKEKGGDLANVRSVASVFVSRIDTVVDQILEEKISRSVDDEDKALLASLRGQTATANCRLIYEIFRELFRGEKFRPLVAQGAALQRVLWGSTSAKNPAYSDIKYVQDLIARHTVNTVPEKTLTAFAERGEVQETLTAMTSRRAEEILSTLRDHEVQVSAICDKLLADGVGAFAMAFTSLLEAIGDKAEHLCRRA